MSNFNNSIQKICGLLFLLTVILKGCNLGLKMFVAENKYSEAVAEADEIFSETSPEEYFAYLDGGDYENTAVYAELLDSLKKECFETKNEIALLVGSSKQTYKKAGYDVSFADVLDEYLIIADSSNSTDSCRDMLYQ